MTRAETITFAIDAGFNPMNSEEMDMFVAFAKLVAEREREACAKLLETTDLGGLKDNPAMQSWVAEMLLAYVKAIRARGKAEEDDDDIQDYKKPWVGLTDEETRGCIEATIEITDPLLLDAVNAVIIDVERLLREKNT